jgi:hypothetical protein
VQRPAPGYASQAVYVWAYELAWDDLTEFVQKRPGEILRADLQDWVEDMESRMLDWVVLRGRQPAGSLRHGKALRTLRESVSGERCTMREKGRSGQRWRCRCRVEGERRREGTCLACKGC